MLIIKYCFIMFYYIVNYEIINLKFIDIYDAADTYSSIGNKSPSSQFNHSAFTFPGSTLV